MVGITAGIVFVRTPIMAVAQPDPLSAGAIAAFVGLALIQGAISYVGGKIMSQIMGDPSITDVHGWIEEAVGELESFVSAELQKDLDEKVIEQMRANLQGTITNLTHYADLSLRDQKKDRWLYLVQDADEATSVLLPLSMNYDQAIFISTVAMGYRLIALQALFKVGRDAGDITSAKIMMDSLLTYLVAARNRVAAEMSPAAHIRTSLFLYSRYNGNPRGPNTGRAVWAEVFVDGKSTWKDVEWAGPGVYQSVHDAMQAVVSQLSIPFQKQTDDFIAKVNASINLLITCYDDMNKQIGNRYAPPPGVLAEVGVPGLNQEFWKGPVSMRGAHIGALLQGGAPHP